MTEVEYAVDWEVDPDRFIRLRTFNHEDEASEELRRRVRNNPRGTYRLTQVITETTVLVTVVGKKQNNKQKKVIVNNES